MYQSYVDGKFSVALKKFFGAVERIGYPQGLPFAAHFIILVGAFFAQQGPRRCHQGFCYDGMCTAVGQRKGRVVGLALHLPVGVGTVVYFHDGLSGRNGGANGQRKMLFCWNHIGKTGFNFQEKDLRAYKISPSVPYRRADYAKK